MVQGDEFIRAQLTTIAFFLHHLAKSSQVENWVFTRLGLCRQSFPEVLKVDTFNSIGNSPHLSKTWNPCAMAVVKVTD